VSGRDELHGISNRLVAHIGDLHALERQSRTVPIGSPEFVRLSADVTALARDVLRLSAEQATVARGVGPEPATIDELDASEANRRPLPPTPGDAPSP
jgi:hypothetical protein